MISFPSACNSRHVAIQKTLRSCRIMSGELTISFLGALQASLSVLLVIFYGVLAAQFKFLEDSTTKQISSLCIRMFLPALLATNVGSQLHAETGLRYVPILSKLPRPWSQSTMLRRQYGEHSIRRRRCSSVM